ncbi:MAG: DegT/DnrJ/EryC1/StrS family aminotransferase [Candidatus Omnitrophota bacterium]
MKNRPLKLPNKDIVQRYKLRKPLYVTRPFLPALADLNKYLKKIWKSQWVTNNGVNHVLLEKKLAAYLKVKNNSLFCNGTLALQLAVNALRLTGEVITTPFTFAATPHVLYWNNIRPVFCDIQEDTYNLDVHKIESLITPETTAILAVHVFGNPCDVEALEKIAQNHGLKIIYDAAHAFGVEVNGVGIGNFGDASMFSFHATKIFSTIEGGCLACRSSDIKERVDYLRNFGIKSEEEIVVPGINAKMNEIQAAIGLIQLKAVDREIKKRKRLIEFYKEGLKNVPGIILPRYLDNVKYNYQSFVVRINGQEYGTSRDCLYGLLRQMNIVARKYFYPLCSHYSCYKSLPSANPVNLPVAEKISKEVLSLPLYGELTKEEVNLICNILKDIHHENKKA